jgi:hypothetical protein
MATIKFYLQSKNNPAGIYVRLRDGIYMDAKAKTKLVINPSDWSTSKGRPLNLKDASFKKLNEDLESLKNNLLIQFNKDVSIETINSQLLKDFINTPIKENAIPQKLVDYFDYYSLHKKSDLKASSHIKLNVNKHLVERFQKATKRVYFIKDVNADFKLHFEAYCLAENYSRNTIARVHTPVKLTTPVRSKLTTYFTGEDFKSSCLFWSLTNI